MTMRLGTGSNWPLAEKCQQKSLEKPGRQITKKVLYKTLGFQKLSDFSKIFARGEGTLLWGKTGMCASFG